MHHVDHNGTFQQWSYVGTTYGLASFKEAVRATANYQANPAVAATCNNSGTTACFTSTRWTLPVSVTRTDIKVYESGIEITNYSLSRSGSDTILTFASDQTFDASDTNPNNTTGVSVEITNNRMNLEQVCEKLFQTIFDSRDKLPQTLTSMCKFLSDSTDEIRTRSKSSLSEPIAMTSIPSIGKSFKNSKEKKIDDQVLCEDINSKLMVKYL